MNTLVGTIQMIHSRDGVSLVDLDVQGVGFTALTLETPETHPYLMVGSEVDLLFKETEVAVARDLSGKISLRNRMNVIVDSIESGEILTRVIFNFGGSRVQSIITTRSAKMLELSPGCQATALVKATEITLRAR